MVLTCPVKRGRSYRKSYRSKRDDRPVCHSLLCPSTALPLMLVIFVFSGVFRVGVVMFSE